MRIIHVGNLANNSYKMVKYLRQQGCDAELALDASQAHSNGNGDPAWEDPELTKGYPDWIHVLPPRGDKSQPFQYVQNLRERKRMLTEGYDIIHAQCTVPSEIQFYGRPFVAHSLGSDLRELAHQATLRGMLMRRAFTHCQLMLFNNIDQVSSVDKFDIRHGHFYPNPIDFRRFTRETVSDEHPGRLKFFHPTRLDWCDQSGTRSSTKGNDRMIRAFKRITIEEPSALLIMIESGVDIDATKQLVAELALEEHVQFIPRLKKEKLITALNAADVIVDQFDIGAFGGMALEALACGKPLVTYIKADAARRCYGEEPPILNGSSEDEIYACLHDACQPDIRCDLGNQARQWSRDHHDSSVLAKRLIGYYEEILS